MIHSPNFFHGGRHLGKHPRETLRGFHVISRNFVVRVARTATCVGFREIPREMPWPNAALVLSAGAILQIRS